MLINSEENISLLRRLKKDPSEYRPDILHQELLSVLDSPLNKAGKVKLYVRTEKNVLIEINPKCRIPRTFKRFSSLMVQLLHQLKIRSSDNEMLLKVIKNPVSRYIPAGSKCYGFSQHGKLYSPLSFSTSLPDDVPIVLVLGAMAKGSITKEDNPYIEEMISISEYPLSGSVAINRILGAIEHHWGVV
jgi:rRNA small subunit pseudouridine methyltransferase Nep1